MLIKLKCYHCGAEVNADDSQTQVLCDACGTKLNVPPKTPASGRNPDGSGSEADSSADTHSVKASLPSALKNALAYYDKGSYESAYKAFNDLANSDRSVWGAKLFAGLSLAAQSKVLDLKIGEGVTAVKNASAVGYFGDDKCEIVSCLVERVVKFSKEFYKANYAHDSSYCYEDAYRAKDHFDGTLRIVEYLEACSDLMNQESLQRWKELEDVKKKLVQDILDFIKEASKTITYLVGYKTAMKGSQIVTERVDQKMPCPFVNQYRNISEKVKEAFNTVPSTVNRLKKYDEDIAANKAIIDDYKRSSEEYFALNPEDAKVYKRWRLFTSKKKIAEIESRFPQTLANKKIAAEKSEKLVSSLTAEKKKFEKANTI